MFRIPISQNVIVYNQFKNLKKNSNLNTTISESFTRQCKLCFFDADSIFKPFTLHTAETHLLLVIVYSHCNSFRGQFTLRLVVLLPYQFLHKRQLVPIDSHQRQQRTHLCFLSAIFASIIQSFSAQHTTLDDTKIDFRFTHFCSLLPIVFCKRPTFFALVLPVHVSVRLRLPFLICLFLP